MVVGVVRALAQGMCEVERYVRDLGEINNAKITTSLEEAAVSSGGNEPYVHEHKPQRRNSELSIAGD